MLSLEKIWTTKFVWWFIQCTLIRNGAFGSIHNWGTKKECLIEKGLQRTTLDFFLLYIIIIIMDFCMPIDKMVSF
jgi:hypothetical protein